MRNEAFEIATEDGSKFCTCDNKDGIPVLYNKEGRPLPIHSLMEQAYHPEIARKMRKRKAGKRPLKQPE